MNKPMTNIPCRRSPASVVNKNDHGRIASFVRLTWLIALATAFPGWTNDVVAAENESAVDVVALELASDFVQTYCIDCHNEDYAEADRQFDELGEVGLDDHRVELWHDVLDRVQIGDMPPADAEQPDDEERLAVAAALTQTLSDYAATHQPPSTHWRRLNRREYDAAIRYALDLQPMLTDVTADFSPDESVDHFDNVGDALIMSDFLLRQSLIASAAAIEIAKEWSDPTPLETQTRRFEAPFCRSRPNPDGMDVEGRYQHLRENPSDHDGYLYLRKLKGGVERAGRYRIRVRASGIDRRHPYNDAIIQTATEDPLRLALVASDTSAGDMESNNPTDRPIASFEVEDDQPQWYEATTWLDRGWTPRMTFPNGPARIKYMRHRLLREHRDLFPNFISRHVNVFGDMHPEYDKTLGPRLEAEFLAQQDRFAKEGRPSHVFGTAHRMHTDEAWMDFYREYRGPRLRVFEVQLIGPLRDPDQPDSVAERRQWFFPNRDIAIDEAVERLGTFIERAWRRTVDRSEWRSIESLIRHSHDEGMSIEDALHLGYQAALCSPSFLYHRTVGGPLAPEELANRLSFFLNGQPATESLRATFRQAAKQGSLAEALRRATDRLIDSEPFVETIDSLAESWLRLDKLGTMLPDRLEHPNYYNEQLESSMRRETRHFLVDAFRQNHSIATLIDSDMVYVNGPLARLYGIDGITGDRIRPIKSTDSRRGGLMTMASVLTASANGIDTSPVLRGIWVLEAMLGTPPSPAPPDIEPIEPDVRGTTTIREQLQSHRNNATCAACHSKIDPPGFALESFDELGRFRERYDRFKGWRQIEGPPVDPSGKWALGQGSFEDVSDLKRMMLRRSDLVRRNVIAKLVTAATGRIDDHGDRASVASLASANPRAGLRDLIHAVVQSDAFAR